MPMSMATASRMSFDDDDGGEAREPVGRFAHGQSVMDAAEIGVALAPQQLRRIKGGNDVKKQ